MNIEGQWLYTTIKGKPMWPFEALNRPWQQTKNNIHRRGGIN